ncbi:MAG: DUF4249 domain-containing protein [Flavobacteriales bacterium]|nr:DUF4249 domain-containing protein [Flavobacteriales bacterium]
MNRFFASISILLAVLVGFSSCEKVLDIDLPDAVNGIVFEGYIENGTFPYVLVSRSENYFSPINTAAEAIINALVTPDSVFITVDGVRTAMDKTCLSELSPEEKELALEFLGFESFPDGLDLCLYLKFSMQGEYGKTYRMTAYVEGKEYNAVTTIGQPVELDSLWYKDELPIDSFGSIWCRLSDRVGTDDYYYMWTENLTEGRSMYAIDGSPSFGDRLFQGETIEFNFYQGSNLANDNGNPDAEPWWFREGDTVIVKLGIIDRAVYDFWESVDAASNLNPFSAPTPVWSNFDNGGRGVWAGYATTVDTFVCVLNP